MDLKSTKLESDKLNKELQHYVDILNGIPLRKQRCVELYKSGDTNYTKKKYDKDIKELEKQLTTCSTRKEEIETKLSKLNLSANYKKSLDLYSKEYLKILKDASSKPEKVEEILKRIVDQIIVYSRPVTEEDTIAGVRKNNQQIPYKLDIKLRLPKQMLEDFAIRAEFEGKENDYNLAIENGMTKIKNPETGEFVDLKTEKGKNLFIKQDRFGVKNRFW